MQELLHEIKKLKKSNVLIIVEGKKDKKALENLGIKNIMTLKKALFMVVEEIVDKEVAILTDLDKEGKKIYSRLRRDLSQRGVKINNRFRNFLFRKTKLRQIEGIDNYLERIKERREK